MTDVLSTPRLVLRPFVPEDGAEMFRVWASDPQVTRFLRWTPHKDEAESLALARQWAADRQAHQWAIVRGCDGQLMGSIGVVPAWSGRPVTVTSTSLMPTMVSTMPTWMFPASRTGPCSMCSSIKFLISPLRRTACL